MRCKKYRYGTFIAFSLLLLSSCAKPQFSDLLKGKFKDGGDAPKNIFEANVQNNDPDPVASPAEEKIKSIRDDRDSIPYLFLKIAASKTDKVDSILYYYSKPFTDFAVEKAKKRQLSYTEYKVKFVYSLTKKFFNDVRFLHPNSRVDALIQTLTLKDPNNVCFYSIDKIKNDYGEVDLGTVERNQETKFNANLNVENTTGSSQGNKRSNKTGSSVTQNNGTGEKVYDVNGNVIGTIDNGTINAFTGEGNNENNNSQEFKSGAKADASFANTTAIKESRNVKFQKLDAGFSFDRSKLTLSQEGKPNGGVSNNAYVTATLRFENTKDKNACFNADVCSFSNLYSDNNVQTVADKLEFGRRTIKYLPCDVATDIIFSVNYTGSIRAVTNQRGRNSRNAMEFDDKVVFYKISDTPSTDLTINKNAFCKKIFHITVKDKSKKLYTLQMASPNPKELFLFSDDNPEVFYQWILDALQNPSVSLLKTTKFRLYFLNGETKVPISGPDTTNTTINEIHTKIDLNTILLEEVKR